MSSTVITIPGDTQIAPKHYQKLRFSGFSVLSSVVEKASKHDTRRVVHSIKVGVALVLVSLLYLLDPLFKQVGQNAMWAIMTVVVIFEFYAGATLSKGLNRGIGTVLGGGLGCLAAILADNVGGVGNCVVVGTSVFILGAAGTYCRLIPSIKRRYDYAAMIFILTFNLVVVSGVRADKVMELARDRLSTIAMGFAICIFISLLIFPVWASDELHHSTASKFDKLANCIQGCMEEYFRTFKEKRDQPKIDIGSCKAVLQSKLNDESLAHFARWEPWHGKFGLSYPWDRYLRIADALRELAATVIAWKGCIQSPRQPSSTARESIQQPCEAVGLSLAQTLKELGQSIRKMERCSPKASIASKLHSMKLELNLVRSTTLQEAQDVEGLAMASFVFVLMEMVEKVETLAKEVQELGENAHFRDQIARDFNI